MFYLTSCITVMLLLAPCCRWRDEEEAQTEAALAVPVAVGDDLEAFEHGDDVLARHALAGDGAVFCG